MLSDHSLIVASFELIDRRTVEKSIMKCQPWHSFDYDAFAVDRQETELICNPPTDMTELFATLIRLLDKHAQLQNLRVRAHHVALWFDMECRDTKVKSRKLE